MRVKVVVGAAAVGALVFVRRVTRRMDEAERDTWVMTDRISDAYAVAEADARRASYASSFGY